MTFLYISAFFFLFLHKILSYTFSGNQITDLETTSLSGETSAWSNSATTSCQGYTIIGGYFKFGSGASSQRTYALLPAHNMVYLSIDIWRIDSWDSGDYAQINIDSVSYKVYSLNSGSAPSNLCGSPFFNDLGKVQVIIHQQHSASTLTLKVISGLNGLSTDESVAFRNVKIIFVQAATLENNTLWTIGNYMPPGGEPSCSDGYYFNQTYLTCAKCDSACKNCTGGTNANCIACNTSYYKSSTVCLACHISCYSCSAGTMNDCTNCFANFFLFPNGQCLSNCPIASAIVNSVVKCNFPCAIGKYLYPDNSCTNPGCITGFNAVNVSSVGGICDFACGSTFRYENSSCIANCPSSFSSITLYGKNFCNFNCSNGLFLYQNGSCISSCNNIAFNSLIQGTEKYCNYICAAGEFYYTNGSCQNFCNSPFIPTAQSIAKYCNFPCPNGQFLLSDGSCTSTCFARGFENFTQGLEKYCNFYCAPGEYLLINDSCSLTCSPGFTEFFVMTGKYCESGCPLSQFVYANDSCLQTCNMPGFTSTNSGVQVDCIFHCNIDEYYYMNGTCSPTCTSPFISQNISVGGYCLFPCPTGSYYLQNGSCSAYCPSEYQVIDIILGKFCDFPCQGFSYSYQNGTCSNDCPLPFLRNFFSVGELCVFPCANTSFYLQNSSCSPTCPELYSIIDINVGKFCSFPCSSSKFFLENGTCSDVCESPYIISNFSTGSLCEFPCANTSFYLSNGTCLSTCPTPFLTKHDTMGSYCEFPCSGPDYFYFNNTCNPVCEYPLLPFVYGVEKYCYFPCQPNEYLYANNSCLATCSDPFIPSNKSVGDYCSYKCKPSQFLFENNCANNCSFPYTSLESGLVTSCNFPCLSWQYFQSEDRTCRANCKSPYSVVSLPGTQYKLCNLTRKDSSVTQTTQTITSLTQTALTTTLTATSVLIPLGFDPTTAAAILQVMQSFYFVLFYNVEYPTFVTNILSTFSISLFNFLPNPTEWVLDPIPDLPSPKNFYDNNFTGFFLNTAFQCVVLLVAIYAALMIAHLTTYLRRPIAIVRLGRTVKEYMDRSFRIRFVLSIYSQLLLAGYLQALVLDFSHVANAVSYVFAMISIWICLYFPIYVLRILGKKNTNYNKLKLYSALIEDYDINHPEIRIFSFYVVVRRTLHCTALVFLYYMPILQCIFPWIANLVMIVLMIRYKPHNRVGLNAYDLISEIGFFGAHSAILTLAYVETVDNSIGFNKDIAGYLLVGSMGFVFLFTLYSIWKENLQILFKVLKWISEYLKNKCKKKDWKPKTFNSRENNFVFTRKKIKRNIKKNFA